MIFYYISNASKEKDNRNQNEGNIYTMFGFKADCQGQFIEIEVYGMKNVTPIGD